MYRGFSKAWLVLFLFALYRLLDYFFFFDLLLKSLFYFPSICFLVLCPYSAISASIHQIAHDLG